jgi:hypothetical protein
MDDKINLLSGLVRPPGTLFSVICSIHEPEFNEIVKESQIRGDKGVRAVLGKHTFNTAYAMLFHNTIAQVLNHVRHLGIVGDQVDFVFDRENELFDNANALLRKMRPTLEPDIRCLLGDAVQRDEDHVLPLQAADLIAARSKDQCNDPNNQKFRDSVSDLAGTSDFNTTCHIREHNIRNTISAVLGGSSGA